MFQYIWILIWLAFVFFLTNQRGLKKEEVISGKNVKRQQVWFAVLVFAPIVWETANRPLWFGDTWGYYLSFQAMPSNISQILTYLDQVPKDKGFAFVSILIKAIVGADYVAYFMVIAAIQSIFLIGVYRRYSINYIFSVALFVLSTDYIAWMHNGMRQFLAAAVIFGATSLMLKRKYPMLLLIIWIASTFHQSALLMIPFVIIAQGKAWNRRTLFFIVMSIVVVMFIGNFTNFLDSALQETQYANVFSDARDLNDNGTNPIRVLVYSVPTILAFIGRRTIRQSDDPVVHFCTNMSIMSTGLYVVSMLTSGVYLGRLPIYCSLFNYILLPWEMKMFFNGRSKKIAYIGVMGLYLLFYYYQMHMAWGLI